MDNNARWAPHLTGFDLPAPPRQPATAQEVDRSWLPKPSSAPGNIDWWRHGGAQREWRQALDFAEKDHPLFFQQLQSVENELVGLERTGRYDPRIESARREVAKYYAQLGRLHDQHIRVRCRTEPFVRY